MFIKAFISLNLFVISSISSIIILNTIKYEKNQTIFGPMELAFINCSNSCIDLNPNVYINFIKISFQQNIKQIELINSFFNLYNNSGLILEVKKIKLLKNNFFF